MTRDEMINVLIEDRLADWVYAQNTDELEECLLSGWKGFDEYSDKELKDMIEDYLDPDQVNVYLKSSKRRRVEQRKR